MGMKFKNITNIRVLRPFVITAYIIIKRAVPIIAFAILLGMAAYMIDQWHVKHQRGEDFISYYSFDVQNAREGEDVYFKVCRYHTEQYNYTGNLTIYLYKNNDPSATPVKVYARDIKGSLRGDCENKVIQAADYYHAPGTYKMGFCVDFTVQYGIPKRVCKESNIYKIYPQPDSISTRISYYQKQIEILNRQLEQAKTDAPTTPNDTSLQQSMAAPQQDRPQSQSSYSQPVATAPPSQPAPKPAAPTCTANLLGVSLLCTPARN